MRHDNAFVIGADNRVGLPVSDAAYSATMEAADRYRRGSNHPRPEFLLLRLLYSL